MKVPDLFLVRSGHRMLATALAILGAGSACWAQSGRVNPLANQAARIARFGTANVATLTNLGGSTVSNGGTSNTNNNTTGLNANVVDFRGMTTGTTMGTTTTTGGLNMVVPTTLNTVQAQTPTSLSIAPAGTAGATMNILGSPTRLAMRSPVATPAPAVHTVVTPPAWATAGDPKVQFKQTPSGVIYFIPGQ